MWCVLTCLRLLAQPLNSRAVESVDHVVFVVGNGSGCRVDVVAVVVVVVVVDGGGEKEEKEDHNHRQW